MTTADVNKLYEKVEIIRKLLPIETPDNIYYSYRDDEKRDELFVTDDKGNKVDLNCYKEILIVGNEVINVTYNSLRATIKVILSVLINAPYHGRIGSLI